MPERDKPEACEIEVTPEMIKAGMRVFCAFDSRFDGEEDAVKSIFHEMWRAHGSISS